MCLRGTAEIRRQRRYSFAAAVLLLIHSPAAFAENPLKARSLALLPITRQIDGEAVAALQQRSLPALRALYTRLQAHSGEVETLLAAEGQASACDLALSNLELIVAFAVNKLDGEGRYEDWMEGESIRLLADYRELVPTCAADAGSVISSGLQAGMIEAL